MDLFGYPFKYVIDTSALIDLKNNYPPTVFRDTVWKDFDHLFRTRAIISVREVYLELKRGSDFLTNWSEQHQECFLYPESDECFTVQSLQESFDNFVELNKNGPHADPWVIACALKYDLIIIQHERLQNNKQKLPYVAQQKNIRYIRIPDLFENEKLKY